MCQPTSVICVGTFQPSFAASKGMIPCMAASNLDFSVQIPSTFLFRRRWHTLHAISQAPKEHSPSSGLPSTISEHNFQASSGTEASSNLACNIPSTSATMDNTKNFGALLEHGLAWVTVFGPTSLDCRPKNTTKGRGIQESTGNSQIAKLLAGQKNFQGEGVCDTRRCPAPTSSTWLGGSCWSCCRCPEPVRSVNAAPHFHWCGPKSPESYQRNRHHNHTSVGQVHSRH